MKHITDVDFAKWQNISGPHSEDDPIPLSSGEALRLACKATNKHGMYVNFEHSPSMDEVPEAAPWLKNMHFIQLFFDGHGMILFSSEEQMLEFYDRTVGDDGPTASNPYNGPARVYALTCYPDGTLGNENT